MVKNILLGMPLYLYIILFISVGLIIAGFVVPPIGEISPSVLQGVGEIILGTWLLYTTANIPTFLREGAKIKAQIGNASIEVGRHKKHNEEIEDENIE